MGHNNVSTELLQESRMTSANATSERLLNYGKQIHLKRQMRAEEKIAQTTAEFDFKPRINHRSRSIANQKKNIQNQAAK